MSWKGELLAIQIAEKEGGPVQALEQVEAVAGKGFVGDRHFGKEHRQVTLIAAETLEEVDVDLSHADTRRDLLVRGVPLNALLDRRFRIGDLVLEGAGPCEPCGYMERLCGKAGAKEALVGRGGLCARIIEGGKLRVGAEIVPL